MNTILNENKCSFFVYHRLCRYENIALELLDMWNSQVITLNLLLSFKLSKIFYAYNSSLKDKKKYSRFLNSFKLTPRICKSKHTRVKCQDDTN
jgi:hypothetical protein